MKVITNQAKSPELKTKIEEAIVDPPVATPENDPEKVVVDFKNVLTKDPDSLTDEEQTAVEEHKDELTDEQKLAFHIIDKLPEKSPVVAPVTKETNIDYKARYAGSTQEAQILAARNKEFLDAKAKADAVSDPTDDEMKKEYGDEWDEMSDRQKKNAKGIAKAQKKDEILTEVTEKMKRRDEWVESTKKFSTDPATITKYPQLEGHEEEFIQFCSLPTRVGLDYDLLISAFSSGIKPVIVPPKRANLFETGGGGGGAAPTVKELTVDEIAFLRKNNPREYKRLIQAKKIKVDF